MSNHSHKSDFGPALTGLIVGGCVIFALVFGIVVMTSHRYADETTTKADSTATSGSASGTSTDSSKGATPAAVPAAGASAPGTAATSAK